MSTAKGNLIAGSYWTGIAMTLVCLALMLAGNTDPVWLFEHRGFPLSWVFGCAAIFAFLVCELCQSVFPRPSDPRRDETEEHESQFAPAWESAESMYK
jgi:hypothetical protein